MAPSGASCKSTVMKPRFRCVGLTHIESRSSMSTSHRSSPLTSPFVASPEPEPLLSASPSWQGVATSCSSTCDDKGGDASEAACFILSLRKTVSSVCGAGRMCTRGESTSVND